LAGKKAKCPKCGKSVPVPAPPQDVDVDLIFGHHENVPVDDETADEVIDDLQDDEEPIILRGRGQGKAGKLHWIIWPLLGAAVVTTAAALVLVFGPRVLNEVSERLPQPENVPTTLSLTEKQKTAAADAIKALGKVEAAVEVGVNFQRYSELVIDAKAAVNDAERALPTGEPLASLREAMGAYADGVTVWNHKIQFGGLGLKEEFGHGEIIARYKLPLNEKKRASEDVALQVIWAAARKATERARSLLK
jgi:hypothetical protein